MGGRSGKQNDPPGEPAAFGSGANAFGADTLGNAQFQPRNSEGMQPGREPQVFEKRSTSQSGWGNAAADFRSGIQLIAEGIAHAILDRGAVTESSRWSSVAQTTGTGC